MNLGATIFIAALATITLAVRADTPADAAGVEFFESKIRPVFVERCYQCHSGTAKQLKAGLRLDSRTAMLKGGESDLPAVVPGNLDDSTLIRAIRYEDEGLQMPPKEKLPAEQIAAFEQWIKQGAPTPPGMATSVAMSSPTTHPVAMTLDEGRKFWSFIKPRDSATGKSVDDFIHAKLADVGLKPSPPADKRTLLRRATYDLIGLPPTPAEVEAFENDASPDAFAKVIDRLLASPHYGERWGRYWLDIARYADTKGYVFEEERRYAFSYTYRDWVIRALNEDLPYDQFLIQQIAADRLELKDDKRPLAALGFLTLGRRFLNVQADIIDDRIDVVTRGTMALTVSCARCHDHKYDPIPTADYYSLYGVFASSTEPDNLPLIGGEKHAQTEEFEKELAKRKADAENFTTTRHAELVVAQRTKQSVANYLLASLKAVAEHPLGEDFEVPDDAKGVNQWMTRRWEAYLKATAGKSDDVFALWRRFAALPATQFEKLAPSVVEQSRRMPTENPLVARFVLAGAAPRSIQEVAERYAAAIIAMDDAKPQADPSMEALRRVLRGDDAPANVPLADAKHLFCNVDRMKRRQLQTAIDTHVATHPGSPPRAMAVEDLPQPMNPHVFVRGNPASPGKEVPRQFPAILTSDDRKPFAQGSGRLEFAKAIASKENPLTARTIVNRLWKYHFGHGLVRTPSDFGTRGDMPTHPELLDWLAVRFTGTDPGDDAWSLKKLHKRMMLSAVYQQSSIDANPAARMKDPENRLLWRFNSQRLDFESMRDSLLVASNALDRTMGGRGVDIFAEPFVPRRSVYAFIERQNLPGTFRTFDFASPDTTSAQRFATSVPQQALYMMNSPFVVEQARKVAAREEIAKTPEPPARVTKLYQVLFGRAPTKDELELGVKFIKTESEQPAESLAVKPNVWKYGYGEFDESTQRLKNFYPLPHFTGKEWQGGPALPDPTLGWAMLTAHGGHAGNVHAHAVVRRWIAPRYCTIGIVGTLTHTTKEGDGVRGRLVSSREGSLASWQVHNKNAGTRVGGVNVKAGDTIDFIVDCGRAGDVSHDQFGWKVKITKEAPQQPIAGDDTGSGWDSITEFRGPDPKPPTPLNAWEKYAQVLLESNEFVFVE